jgi:hypothetical protein
MILPPFPLRIFCNDSKGMKRNKLIKIRKSYLYLRKIQNVKVHAFRMQEGKVVQKDKSQMFSLIVEYRSNTNAAIFETLVTLREGHTQDG